MLDLLVDKVEVTTLVAVLVLFIYWVVEWVKKVLKDKLSPVWIQPISLLISTILASFVLFTYDFRPLDLGIAKYIVVDFILQGALLAALAGVFYDKVMQKLVH